MKKIIIRTTLILAILGILSAFYVYEYVINKPHPDYEKIEPVYIILAADLFDSYRDDRLAAEKKYNGQIIQLNGTCDRFEQKDSLLVGVFVFEQGMFGEEGIRCTLLDSQKESIEDNLTGQEVRIKGLVTGYNETDVILEKCSIIH